MARVKARKDAMVMKSREGVEKWMRGLDHVDVIRRRRPLRRTGHASRSTAAG